jgi:hypothetical protein
MNLAICIPLARPAAQWSLRGDSLDGLTWHGPGEPPTLEELQTAWDNRPSEPLPDAEKYQVLDWLDDHGITEADVDAALQSISDETQRRKALLRWHSVSRIPADNAFVLHVAAQLNIDHLTAWSQILAK